MSKEPFLYFWSRKPGAFVDKTTGEYCTGASFCGDDREWCETLIEVIYDVHNSILRRRGAKALPPKTEFCVPRKMMDAIETSVLYRPGEPSNQGLRTGRIGSLDFTVVELDLPDGYSTGMFVMDDGRRILAGVSGLDL